MFDDYNSGFPWIKFGILCVLLVIPIWMMAPTLKWKFLFAFSVPIGVGLALSGKSMRSRN